MALYWLDKIIIDTAGLKYCDPITVKWLDACGHIILWSSEWNDNCWDPLTLWEAISCYDNSDCPAIQPIITNITKLPWMPECCPWGLLWWTAWCELTSICPSSFETYFWWRDRYVLADPSDTVPWTLIQKLISCNPNVLSIWLDLSWGNHKVELCINAKNLDIDIIDLKDWPGSYPNCSWNNAWVLTSVWSSWNRTCAWWNLNYDCLDNPEAFEPIKVLQYNDNYNAFTMTNGKAVKHAEVWYIGPDRIYTGSSLTNDLELTTIPCRGRGKAAGWDHEFDCMYVNGTTQTWWHSTWDILIPESWYWLLNFRTACQCNKYTHAFRMWVCIVWTWVEDDWVVLSHVKKWAMRDLYQPPHDWDETFIWEELYECDSDPKTIMTNLKESEMSWGSSEIYWLNAWTRLRMFIKADGNNQCVWEHPPSKVRMVGYNEYTTNHPKSVVAWFSVMQIPKEVIQ